MFITFEGIDGSGKTTQSKKLKKYLEALGHEVILTREPGGTKMAESIRHLLLHVHEPLDPFTEVYLYSAARNEHYQKIIAPALARNAIVICDRFYDSTIAYQGYGRKLDVEEIRKLNQRFIDEAKPNITFFMDTPLTIIEERLNHKELDRMEKEGIHFMADVRQGYLTLLEEEPDRFVVIDGSLEEDINQKNIQNQLKERFDL